MLFLSNCPDFKPYLWTMENKLVMFGGLTSFDWHYRSANLYSNTTQRHCHIDQNKKKTVPLCVSSSMRMISFNSRLGVLWMMECKVCRISDTFSWSWKAMMIDAVGRGPMSTRLQLTNKDVFILQRKRHNCKYTGCRYKAIIFRFSFLANNHKLPCLLRHPTATKLANKAGVAFVMIISFAISCKSNLGNFD